MAEVYVGIDVAKDGLDVALRPSGKHWRVSSDDAGLVSLLDQLQEERLHLVVLEATEGYEVPVVAALGAGGIPPGGGEPQAGTGLCPFPGTAG